MAKFTEDKEKYLKAQSTIVTLLKTIPSLPLEPKKYNINYVPPETIIYIDKEFMIQFEPVKDIPIRDYKLINYGKPAVNLVYSTKHKYFLKKEVDEKSMKVFFQNKARATEIELHTAENKLSEINRFSGNEEEKEEKKEYLAALMSGLHHRLTTYTDIVNHTGKYTFAISNYEMEYIYTVLTFKYSDPVSGKLISENAHIVKDFVRQAKTITEKVNIIFIDSEALKKKKAQGHQHKTIDTFLQSFDIKISSGVEQVYAKKNTQKPTEGYIKNWIEFETQFIEFLWQHKYNRRSNRPIKEGKLVREELRQHEGFRLAFHHLCFRLPNKIMKPFKTMFREGYFNLANHEIVEISKEEDREVLLLLLYESLRFSNSANEPIKEAITMLTKRFPNMFT